MAIQTRIIDVFRKPSKCPVCGSEVVDIIYGTGEMSDIEFALEYRRQGIMGGDNIPRRPTVWACACACKRFRKVNKDGTDATVRVKLLKNIKRAPLSVINWQSDLVERALKCGHHQVIHKYQVEVTTELDETETLTITAVNGDDAEDLAAKIVSLGGVGLKGRKCVTLKVYDID